MCPFALCTNADRFPVKNDFELARIVAAIVHVARRIADGETRLTPAGAPATISATL